MKSLEQILAQTDNETLLKAMNLFAAQGPRIQDSAICKELDRQLQEEHSRTQDHPPSS
jgi:hypothetical protein